MLYLDRLVFIDQYNHPREHIVNELITNVYIFDL
jgi:hypothetical protein